MWQKRCGSSGVTAAADGSSGAGPAVGDQSEGRARAFVRMRRPGALTFAAISARSEWAGARVEIVHGFFRESPSGQMT